MKTTGKMTESSVLTATAERVLLLLDYDGTLVELASSPDKVTMDKKMMEALERLTRNGKYRVVITTGRDREDIERRFAGVDIELIAEHGAYIRRNGRWETHIEENAVWKGSLLPVLIEYSIKCPGSFIEEKSIGYAWHYRNSPEKKSMRISLDFLEENGPFLKKFNLKTIHGKKVIEIVPNNVSKGRASILLMQEENFSSVMAIGDDRTDEETFVALMPFEKCATYKVGEGESSAKHRLPGTPAVLDLLERLS